MERIKQELAEGRTALGIEFGSTRIKAVLVDEESQDVYKRQDKNILLSIKHVVLRFFPLPSTKGALLFSGMRLLFALLGALLFLVFKNLVKEFRREQKKKKERQMEMQRRRQQRMQRQHRREAQRR